MMYALLSWSSFQLAPVRGGKWFPLALGLLGLRPAGACLLWPFALAGVAMMYALLSWSSFQLAPLRGGKRSPLALGLLGFGEAGHVCYGRSRLLALP